MPDETTQPVAGAPSDNATIVGVIDGFRERGFVADFFVTPESTVRCGACRHEMRPEELDLELMRRVEGAADPADMAAILGLRCPSCGAKGTAVARVGPEAGPDGADVPPALPAQPFP